MWESLGAEGCREGEEGHNRREGGGRRQQDGSSQKSI